MRLFVGWARRLAACAGIRADALRHLLMSPMRQSKMNIERDHVIILEALATPEKFDELAYLYANPDVAAAVQNGAISSGRLHFDHFGLQEGRRQRWADRMPAVKTLRKKKLERVADFIRSDMEYRLVDGRIDFLTKSMKDLANITDTDNVSCNSYDTDLWSLLHNTKNGLVLDCGSGRRDIYVSNVLNYEIVPYDTTDILGIAEVLPFKNETFDGIISVAVLEHVKHPFQCAEEICRVLKPGGWLFCSVPFLQPYHGYPHHYYNMTHQGIRALFERSIAIERQFVNKAMTPAWTLSWIVGSWANGLPGELREQFLDLRLRDVTGDPIAFTESPYSSALDDKKNFELACATVLIGSKAV
jgi:SAM-dependent methyltransferase